MGHSGSQNRVQNVLLVLSRQASRCTQGPLRFKACWETPRGQDSSLHELDTAHAEETRVDGGTG